jgi:hypothetical protein
MGHTCVCIQTTSLLFYVSWWVIFSLWVCEIPQLVHGWQHFYSSYCKSYLCSGIILCKFCTFVLLGHNFLLVLHMICSKKFIVLMSRRLDFVKFNRDLSTQMSWPRYQYCICLEYISSLSQKKEETLLKKRQFVLVAGGPFCGGNFWTVG